jgi:hypothetical protein
MWRSGNMAPLSLTSVLDGCEWLASCSGLSTPWERAPHMKNSNKLNGKDLKIIRRETRHLRKKKEIFERQNYLLGCKS